MKIDRTKMREWEAFVYFSAQLVSEIYHSAPAAHAPSFSERKKHMIENWIKIFLELTTTKKYIKKENFFYCESLEDFFVNKWNVKSLKLDELILRVLLPIK